MLKHINKWLPLVSILALVTLLAWTILAKPYNNGPAIRSDGTGYHIWVYGIKNKSFKFCEYPALLGPTQSISVVNSEKGRCGVKYPPGVGLMQFPFTAWFTSTDANNTGFSNAEHNAVLMLGAGLFVLVGLFSYLSLQVLGVSPIKSVVAIAALMFGSGLFHYASYDASFSHIYSAFGVAVLLWLVIKNKPISWSSASLVSAGLLIFWMYLVRQTNGAITLALMLLAVSQVKQNKEKVQLLAVWLLATALALCIQLAYNHYVIGQWRISSYGQEQFLKLGEHFVDVIFSYERGLITYYPIFAVAIVLGLAWVREKITFVFIALVFAFAVLYGSWHSWPLGAGMGHRGFVELVPIAIIVLGMGLQKIQSKKYLIGLMLPIAICVYITVAVMLGYWQGSFPIAGANSEQYWGVIR